MPLSRVVLIVMLALVGAHPLAAQDTGVREVMASERAVIPLTTKIRYTTMIVLPDGDEILDVICGDRDFWVIQTTANIAHVKPAKEGTSTNLNLLTASGAVYSFLLTEQKTAATDYKVYVTADPEVVRGPRKFYPAADVEALRAELTAARSLIDAARRQADETIAGFKQDYPVGLQFPYGPLKYERPFLVRSIWHDGAFTYIRTDARELPALYEVKDGAPALLNFQVRGGGTYIVPKVLDRAYLAIGKDQFAFQQGR